MPHPNPAKMKETKFDQPLEDPSHNNYDADGNFNAYNNVQFYDEDDPMLIVLQDTTGPIDTPLGTFQHCCKLLPSICCYHLRTCKDCFKQCDCCAGCIILLPLCTGILAIGAGLGIGAGVVMRDGYYDYYGWHNARDACLPFAIASIVLAGILFYYHPRPIYCLRVQRQPPLRVGVACGRQCGPLLRRREFGSLSTNAKQIARRRSGRLACRICEAECLPLLIFLPFVSAGLWTMYLFSISKSLGYVPMCVVALLSGATTKFSRSRCRRLTRVCCGRLTYETIVDSNPMGGWNESEDDENDWRLTSGSEEPSSSDDDDGSGSGSGSGSGHSDSEGGNSNDGGEESEGSEFDSEHDYDEEDGTATITVHGSGGSDRNVKGANPHLRQRGGPMEV